MRTVAHLALVVIWVLAPGFAQVAAQAPTQPTFDVVSIKRVNELRQSGGTRTLPDGTFRMMNGPIGSLLGLASPVPISARDIVGAPDWLWRELYDVTVKPPEGLTPEQRREMTPIMWRAMFADRMKLVAHIEQREKDAFALVRARSDGRLGPDLKPSTLDCTRGPNTTQPPPPPPTGSPSLQERENRCGLSMSGGLIVSGGVTLDQVARYLGGIAGGEVDNRSGLTGLYSVKLNFSVQRSVGATPDPNATAAADDAPDIFTALQEQLGLQLQRGEKKSTPVFIIDSIERPSEN
jgi:uncharacterized protein (TIGR03435 family)